MKSSLILPLLISLVAASSAAAQMNHGHTDHAQPASPTLPGDDTFGALAEIVENLRSDLGTDWSSVSITALRDHLLDMDAVATGPAPEATLIDGGLVMTIALDSPAGEAARRMVPAHAPVLANETGWRSEIERSGDALIWRVSGNAAEDVAQIRALGFFGLLATGPHHQRHHLAIAQGAMPH